MKQSEKEEEMYWNLLHFKISFDKTWKTEILPIPGEAKAKAMPGRLYIHTINKMRIASAAKRTASAANKSLLCPIWILTERDDLGARQFVYRLI
jgi:hypothetical protein